MRGKLSAGQLPIERLAPNQNNLRLTKLEVARREFVTALALFFQGGDPVSIHVLASAAKEIVDGLNKAAGQKGFDAQLEEYIRDEYREAWRDRRVETYNFMKHAAKDPSAAYEHFNPELNRIVLFGGIMSFWQVCKPDRMMLLYLAWHNKYFPGLIKEESPLYAQMAEATAFMPNDREASLKEIGKVVREAGWDKV